MTWPMAGVRFRTMRISEVLKNVWKTGVPEGLAAAGTVVDAVVLLFAPAVGSGISGFDEKTAEYVTIVNVTLTQGDQ